MSASASFTIDAVIRGYYVYKEIWPNPVDEEELTCECEVGNSHDPLAVAIKKLIDGSNMIVGHVPRRISPLCSVFIRRSGSITCVVSNKMKSLVQSAMEKSHLEPADDESFLQSTSDSHPTSMNGPTTEPSVMDCSSAATQVNDLITIDDIVCSPPKSFPEEFD